MASQTLFTDFLQALGVRHTADYSNQQFAGMPFQSMFGLTKLLEQYGIPSEGLRLSDKSELVKLSVPFLADTPDGFVIVKACDSSNVSYMTQGQLETMPLEQFEDAWNGIVLLAYPDSKSEEPGYAGHRTVELINQAKVWVMWTCTALLFVYLFVTNGIYRHWSTIGMAVIDIIGLILTFMLVQKTLKIKNKAADEVCGVLQEGGCDSILELKASSFFGIFKWSEVGFAYFSVSLLALLMFPQWICYLALCNVCCLPFTVWSIWYQRFRAHKWCTLCVSVQASLWLLFFCYLFGGWYHGMFPLRIEFFVLAVTYIVVLLALNRLLPDFHNQNIYNDGTDQTPSAQ